MKQQYIIVTDFLKVKCKYVKSEKNILKKKKQRKETAVQHKILKITYK